MSTHLATARNAGLTAYELRTLRASLLEQRAFRRDQLRDITHTALPQTRRVVGQLTTAHAEVHRQLAAAATVVLTDIEAALSRMATGCYGSCCGCHRPIAVSRLRICPQTRYCAQCHRVNEAGA